MLISDTTASSREIGALDALAAAGARVHPGARCAILLPAESGYQLEAEAELRAEDASWLREIAGTLDVSDLGLLAQERGAEARVLLTNAAELVGMLVLFAGPQTAAHSDGPDPARQGSVLQLDQICSIAAMVIEQKNLLKDLSYRANHDPLTNLWNRARLEAEVSRALDVAAGTGRVTGLILMDIHAFHLFNELLGRPAANELLRQVAARLNDALEPGSYLARTAGDEFAILMTNLRSHGRVTAFATQLRSWLDKPFLVGDHDLMVAASFGAASANPGECQANELQNRADQALAFAKRSSRGRVATFSAEMAEMPVERLAMEQHLRFALQRRELQLHYQPQVRLSTGELLGVEALLRWKHPSLGYISPMTFIPIAEEIGMIEEIGDWVLDEAIRQLKAWQEAGLAGVRMAVNVSPHQLANGDFAATVEKRMAQTGIQPTDLELEITETALMGNFADGVRQLNSLRALGVQIALDDFGTGHSSLAYLQQLPIDRLKIDRMFVKDIAASDERPALLSTIIQLGLSVGCSVIAEGVETVEQALALSKMDCEEAQGFLFSRPLPAAELLKWAAHDRAEDRLRA